MVSRELKLRLSALRRGQVPSAPLRAVADASGPQALCDLLPDGSVRETERGELFACEVRLRELHGEAERMVARYLAAFARARELAAREALPSDLEPLRAASANRTALIDTETTGLHGRPLFLVGAARLRGGEMVVTQYFARDYAEEPAVLAALGELLGEVGLLVSFNGKAFDWPFVRDRMVYHRLRCSASFSHVDLLHLSRRRWRTRLPDCRLQTLERYLCRRWRSGDIAGAEIPQRYHDWVRRRDPRLVAPIFHHNRLDLITMVELLPALCGVGERAPEGV